MRMLVLGGGLQGSACALDLLRNPDVERVAIADIHFDSLPPFLQPYRGDSRLELLSLDARDEAAVLATMAGRDACMNALPYYFNVAMSTRRPSGSDTSRAPRRSGRTRGR
jgi:lysine 6-dehydrogenase